MTRDDIIRLGRESQRECFSDGGHWFSMEVRDLERFAALVAAEKEQQMIRDGYRKCAEGQRTTQFCGLLDAAVKAEREACAAICDEMMRQLGEIGETVEAGGAGYCAEEIRRRGET